MAPMLRRLVNLPFSVAARAARAFQEREDARTREKYGATQDPGDVAVSDKPAVGPDVSGDPASVRMSAADAVAAVRAGRNAVFVDVREAVGRESIAGANHMPLTEVGIRLSELSDDQLVIAFSDTDAASTRAVLFFRERGIEDAWVLVGGLAAWKAAGGTVVKA
jgi:rhodanese-related sulfurtransferase